MSIVTLFLFSIITFSARSTWSHSDVFVTSVTSSATVPDICLRSFSQVAQSSSYGLASRMWSEHLRHMSLNDVNSKVRSSGSEQDWFQSYAYIFWLFWLCQMSDTLVWWYLVNEWLHIVEELFLQHILNKMNNTHDIILRTSLLWFSSCGSILYWSDAMLTYID
jgi:hypothetical protein